MVIKILDRNAMGADLSFSTLQSLGDLIVYDATNAHEIFERVEDAHVIVTNKVRITQEVMQHAKHLRLVCVFATGYDNIDVKYAKENGIAVCNVPAYSKESVTIYTIATTLALLTNLYAHNAFVRSGEYTDSGLPNRLTPVYHELYGKTWGIVGCGNIGRRVAEVATALGAHVIVHQRHPSSVYPTVDFDTLCRESDILSLHCPLTDSTMHMVDEAHLAMMKPTAILVNEARGAVVDESAVAKAIRDGWIGAYGCDVYSSEPFSKEHPFYSIRHLPNVLLTPHAAWAAYEARVRCLNVIRQNIADFIDGKMTNRVDI